MPKTEQEKLAFFQDLQEKGFTAEAAKQYINAYKNALKSGEVPDDQREQVIELVKLLLEYVSWSAKQ